jgi:hypothetical protein
MILQQSRLKMQHRVTLHAAPLVPAAPLVLAALLVAACGSDPAEPSGVENDLVFERANGTLITFPANTYVWCGAWEPGEVAAPSVHVFVGNPEGGWKLTAVRSDVVTGQPNTFPNNFIWDDPKDADLFIYDPPNELSTQAEESSGSLTFTQLDCERGGRVAFTIDAVVGSEFGDLPPVSVSGSFSGRIGAGPF